jgi:hypothetical protein
MKILIISLFLFFSINLFSQKTVYTIQKTDTIYIRNNIPPLCEINKQYQHAKILLYIIFNNYHDSIVGIDIMYAEWNNYVIKKYIILNNNWRYEFHKDSTKYNKIKFTQITLNYNYYEK